MYITGKYACYKGSDFCKSFKSKSCHFLTYRFIVTRVQIFKSFEFKSLIISSPISLNMCFGAQKNIETVLLSTHNIGFG